MKHKIAYEDWETYDAITLLGLIKQVFPNIKCRKSDNHPPHHHIYLTIKNRRNPHDKGKK